jgi:hypothetical protein
MASSLSIVDAEPLRAPLGTQGRQHREGIMGGGDLYASHLGAAALLPGELSWRGNCFSYGKRESINPFIGVGGRVHTQEHRLLHATFPTLQ